MATEVVDLEKVVADLEMGGADWAVAGTEAGAGAREVGREEVATEGGATVVAGVPVAHRRVSPGDAMATEVAGWEKAVADLGMEGTD